MSDQPAPTPVVTRFAPSPTGYLHVGGARTALFNWLLARHLGAAGRFLLRIEDTDLARSTEEACRQLLEDLRWLGLHWDNEQLVFQSKRKHVYDAIIDDLIRRDLAYEAFDTREELDALRKEAERQKKQFIYRRRPLTDEQIRAYRAEGRPSVVRFAMPVKEYRFRDVVLGKDVVLGPGEVQDFVIRKTDGMPTYHFAVVVDDAEMGVTHVLRGQEHTLNTFLHIAMQDALGYARPTYGHLPIIMNMDGSKMGKRDRDKKIRERTLMYFKNKNLNPQEQAPKLTQQMMDTVAQYRPYLEATGLFAKELVQNYSVDPTRVWEWLDKHAVQMDQVGQFALMKITGLSEADLPEIQIHDFRRNGYLPEALLNFLALLGWNPGGDRERMTVDEMVQLFSADGIGKSNAKFDRTKLVAFNTKAAEEASPERLLAAFKDFLSVNPDSPLNAADDAALAKLLHMKKGFRTFREVEEACRFFFVPDEEVAYDAGAVDKVLKKNDAQGFNALRDVRQLLADASEWAAPTLEATVKQYCERTGLGLGKVAQPIRVAVSGGTVSPPMFESLEFLGREHTVVRIDRCLAIAG